MATAESPMGDTKKAANAAKGAVGFAQNTKKIVQAIKAMRMIATSATGVGALVNLALLLKGQVQKIKKALAAAAALIALYLLWLLAKLAGIIAGLAIGLVTGAPLLLIPGVGPFLYAGYVGYWTYKGLTDPIGTIQLATHPWELVTRPLNWVGNQLSRLGGVKGGAETAAGGVGNAAGNVLGSVGNFVTGLGSSAFGTAAGIATGVVSTAGSIAGSIWGGLTGASSAIAGNIAAYAVGGTMVSVAGFSLLGTWNIDTAHYTQTLDITEAPSEFPPWENELFTVTKTASVTRVPNPSDVFDRIPVTFTITITPKNESITNISLVDNLRYRHGSDPEQPITSPALTCPILPFTKDSPCVLTFDTNVLIIHRDSIITNTIYAETTLTDGSKKSGTATVTVQVGTPGGNCPTGWPITGEVTQGPEGATSHTDSVFGGYEALDIGAPVGTTVYSTLDGTVDYADDSRGSLDQRMGLKPTGCSDSNLKLVHFWHLSAMNFTAGQIVKKGEIVGASGHVAPHLHYQFNGLPNLATGDRSFRMEPLNIPATVPRTCDDLFDPCYVPTTAP